MAKADEKNLLFLETSKLDKLIQCIKEEGTEHKDTIQIQVNLKGLDPRRDNKITKDIMMPYKVRNMDKIIVIADKATSEECEKESIPYALIDTLVQESNRIERERIFKENKYFILSTGYTKVYQLKNFLRQGKIPYQLKNSDKMAEVFEKAKTTYKLRVKDMAVTSFPVGHTEMNNQEIISNIVHGMESLVSYLKKGEDNLKDVIIKRAHGAPKKIY